MRSIWAVATNTIKQALRLKIAVCFTILLIVLLPVMGVAMTGDGTLKGRLQTFVSYGLSLIGFLLCLLTIMVSIYSVTSDIKQRQIYTVLTKPIRRFQFLLGKLLGVILLDLVLLILFSGTIYAITICIAVLGKPIRTVLLGEASLLFFSAIIFNLITIRKRTSIKVLRLIFLSLALLSILGVLIYTIATDRPEFSDEALTQVNNEFFTARAGLTPAEVDVTREVLETYKRIEKSGQLPPEVPVSKLARENYIKALTKQIKLGKRAAEPGHELLWEFDNVKPLDPNESLFVRFKYDVSVNPPDLQIFGRWDIGDVRQIQYGAEIETPVYRFDRKDLIRTFYEIEVQADAVAKDGFLAVRFLNVPLNNTVVIFPPKDGLEVLYKADTFTANFIRATSLMLLRLIFLASLGILSSTFLSFPVAVLFCLVIFMTCNLSGFVLESFDYLSGNISAVYSYTIRPIIQLLPQFDKFSPAKFLVPARLLSWVLLARVAGLMVCIKAVLLFLFALLIFSFREIAKIII